MLSACAFKKEDCILLCVIIETTYKNKACPHNESECSLLCTVLTSWMLKDLAKPSNSDSELNNQA